MALVPGTAAFQSSFYTEGWFDHRVLLLMGGFVLFTTTVVTIGAVMPTAKAAGNFVGRDDSAVLFDGKDVAVKEGWQLVYNT